MYETITYYSVLSFAVLSSILVIGLLSFSCCLRRKTTDIFFLIINLLIVNTLHTIAYVTNWIIDNKLIYGKNKDSNVLCQFQAVMMVFTSMSQEFWVSSITYIFYKLNLDEYYIQDSKRMAFRMFFCCFCSILPLILTLFFYKLQTLGKNKLYCWVKQPTNLNSTFYVQISVYYQMGKYICCYCVYYKNSYIFLFP